MNANSEPTLTIQDFSGLFSKYRGLIITSTLLSAVLFTAAAYKLPKRYKAHFVLTIYSKYFQSPLIGDFVPELSESAEIRSQRESLIREILTPAYLDALGQKYHIYGSQGNPMGGLSWVLELRAWLKMRLQEQGLYQPRSQESALSAEREAMLSRIDIYSLNSTTFNVGFIYSDPSVTFQVTKDLYAQIIQSLLEVRKHTLVNIRDAIRKQLGYLQSDIALSVPVSVVPVGSQTLDEELKDVRNQLRLLTAQYTDQHPLVLQLREREKLLVSRLENTTGETVDRPAGRRKPPAAGSGEAEREIYSDLMRKFNYLNIAIDSDQEHEGDYFATLESPLFPAAPLWPKKGLFVLYGLAFGLFGSLFVAALWEFFDRSTLHASAIAEQLGLPMLGKLPTVPHKKSSGRA